jgi:hypothetical protein
MGFKPQIGVFGKKKKKSKALKQAKAPRAGDRP